jgi:hypothetical protein
LPDIAILVNLTANERCMLGKQMDKVHARRQLAAAVEWALSDRPVPERWTQLTWSMDRAPSKTYTPALGTALLAKAVDASVDALSIKEGYSENAYSQRTLCHTILVPAAVEYSFSLRNTGREPLNNQPFFRYDHIDLIDRVNGGALVSLNELRTALRELNEATAGEALAGLAAFLRVRFEATSNILKHNLPDIDVPIDGLTRAIDRFLGDEVERPKRTQALACAAFDLIFDEVLTRKINDPSRDFPGDVQAFSRRIVIMSAEVRAKHVPATEVRSYVEALRRKDISRGFLVAIHPSHQALDREELVEWAWSDQRVVLTIIESVAELTRAVCAWSNAAVEDVLRAFPSKAVHRLQEIESTPVSQKRWAALIGELIDTP